MSASRQHVPLTAEQRFRLGRLVRAAAQRMPVAEGRELDQLFGRLMADGQYLRAKDRELKRTVSRLRAVSEPPAPDESPIPCVRIAA